LKQQEFHHGQAPSSTAVSRFLEFWWPKGHTPRFPLPRVEQASTGRYRFLGSHVMGTQSGRQRSRPRYFQVVFDNGNIEMTWRGIGIIGDTFTVRQRRRMLVPLARSPFQEGGFSQYLSVFTQDTLSNGFGTRTDVVKVQVFFFFCTHTEAM
jgi:hypothetical protein